MTLELAKLNLEYVRGTEPANDPTSGQLVYRKPLNLTPNCSRELWLSGSRKRDEAVDGQFSNSQLVIIRRREDVTSELGKHPFLEHFQHPLVIVDGSEEYPDEEPKNKAPLAMNVRSMYIVASMVDARDLLTVCAVADRARHQFYTQCITGIFPFEGFTRQDKDTDKSGALQQEAVNIRTVMGLLSCYFDRLVIGEPHSGATAAFAAQFGVPALSLTYAHEVADYIRQNGVRINNGHRTMIDSVNAVASRPDEGRNTPAQKFGENLGLNRYSLSKIRRGVDETEIFEEFNEHDKNWCDPRGRIVLPYDDMISTGSTLRTIINILIKRGAKGIVCCAAHLVLVKEWREVLENPFITEIIATNSREPFGNIHVLADKHQTVSLADYWSRFISLDSQGIDPYTHPLTQNIILS